MARSSATLVLLDGDLPSLVAAAMCQEGRLVDEFSRAETGREGAGSGGIGSGGAGEVLAWIVGTGGRERAAREHAAHYGIRVVAQSEGAGVGPLGAGDPSATSLLVLGCATDAARSGCGSLVWPVQCAVPGTSDGVSVDGIAGAIDRATLLSRVVSLDLGVDFEIRTPFVDLSDRQIADLALDMGIDPSMCWWASDPAGAAEKSRWERALREADAPAVLLPE